MITHKQLTLAEVFEDCQNKFDNDKYQFLSLLDKAINLDELDLQSMFDHLVDLTEPICQKLNPVLAAPFTVKPFSHFDTVCLTTFSLIASSSCDSPFDFLILLILSLSIIFASLF